MPARVTENELPDDVDALKVLLLQRDSLLEKTSDSLEKEQQRVARLRTQVVKKADRIEQLEERLAQMMKRRFGKSSEKHPGQYQLFNEAELLDAELDPASSEPEVVDIPAHQRKRRRKKKLPEDLPQVEVVHDLEGADRQCSCGLVMTHIGEDVSRQLGIVPQQFFAILNKCQKYACSCGKTIKTAKAPKQPIPGSQASAALIAHVMTSKYLDGLPLYRQEKMAGREGIDLPRSMTARWLIKSSIHLQPVFNLLQDCFNDYDIAFSDETGIKVLKEPDRSAQNRSYLWIRRGGPPDKPVVLVDYNHSKSGAVVCDLLSGLAPRSYLVSDGAPNFNDAVKEIKLIPVLCNDHARRRFNDVVTSLKKTGKYLAEKSIALEGVERYKPLYRLERDIKHLSPDEKKTRREKEAVPLWNNLINWATQLLRDGVAHAGTLDALEYLVKHAQGLRRYCDDGRLPISNIQSEHVAKTIAIARKNFLFADTPAGAGASAMIYSLIETARANGHHPQRYLSVLLTELPNVTSVENIEMLLPWAITPEEINRRYASYPAP